MAVNISIGNATFNDHSTGIGTINDAGTASSEATALRELAALRRDLEKTDQLRAAIVSLEQAIREQNKPKTESVVRQLTSNFASSLLANVISNIVNPFLKLL